MFSWTYTYNYVSRGACAYLDFKVRSSQTEVFLGRVVLERLDDDGVDENAERRRLGDAVHVVVEHDPHRRLARCAVKIYRVTCQNMRL